MLDALELSLMAFPQTYSSATNTLAVNLVVLPVGDPTGAVGSVAVFAKTTLKLNVQLITGEALPSTTATTALSVPFSAEPPANAVSLLTSIKSKLPGGVTVTSGKLTASDLPSTAPSVMKSLPPSYMQAFPFSRPSRDSSLFVVGDGYDCALQAQTPANQTTPPALPKTIAWGQIISYILRQPLLAQACGLLYSTTVTINPSMLKDTSWIHFAIDMSSASNPFVSDVDQNPDTVRSYAARVPALTTSRRVFAATLFPVVANPQPTLSESDQEAEIYDDGFAQVVHAYQPPTVDTATGSTIGMAPAAEAGIQLGWDDEQVTIWLNRQLGLLHDRAYQQTTQPESPLGVIGYRVDVSPSGANAWQSLCAVSGSLSFSASGAGSTALPANAELFITPSPVRPADGGSTTNTAAPWLPLYFTAWRGVSLVADDPTISQINPPDKMQPSGNSGNTPLPSTLLRPANLPPPPRYGQSYDFRVRLVDLSGGGPAVNEQPVHPGFAPIGTVAFLRYIPPKALQVTVTRASTPTPQTGTISKLVVQPPLIGYPEAIFAGASPGAFQGASLTALVNAAFAGGWSAGVPDPDVTKFTVTVEAAIPDHDTGVLGSQRGDLDGTKWRIVYMLTENFPSGSNPAATLALSYVDVPEIGSMTVPADNTTTLPIPTARDIRIRLQPLCESKSNYYGTTAPPVGPYSDFLTRQEAATEASLFSGVAAQQLRACYLQPGGDLPTLVAQSFGLTSNGLTLAALPGVRAVFGNSGAVRCTLSPDRSTLTFANANELLGHWIVALTLPVSRDWTWDGFVSPALSVFRDGGATPIGTMLFPRVVAPSALGSVALPADRTSTQLIFIDAISAQPAPGAFPDVLNPQYSITAAFPTATAVKQSWTTLRLPITTPPAQTPKVVATGIAESPYVAASDYSSTQPRDRYLWFEFDAPIADTADDAYFARILAYGPDPLLAGQLEATPVPVVAEPPLAIDPEPVRSVFAGQDSDDSGLDAMTLLTPASTSSSGPDGVHFLLPLPPGLTEDSLQLFGFWTYEFRVGHANSQTWSTAQGRFGRSLRLAGIQHPSPRLTCTVLRNTAGITVTAPYAVTLNRGLPALSSAYGDPQTVLWFMLYTQVAQTDGASQRNVLLTRQVGTLVSTGQQPALVPGSGYLPQGSTTFAETQIESLLTTLGLSRTSPLSVLAVEVLPGPLFQRTNAGVGASGVAAGATSTPAVASSTAATTVTDTAATTTVSAPAEDPIGTQLGQRRILRTSPLVAVPAKC
jgi:hypothetical protein